MKLRARKDLSSARLSLPWLGSNAAHSVSALGFWGHFLHMQNTLPPNGFGTNDLLSAGETARRLALAR